MKDITFAQFWDAYGLKRDKIAAERAWKRLGKRDQRAAFAGIQAYREDCEKHGRMMMYAQGYITHRRWEDDFSADAGESEKLKMLRSLKERLGSKESKKSEKLSAAAGMVNVQWPMNNPQEARDREAESRSRQREEWQRQSVSHEEAKLDPEYLRALREA